MGLGLQRSTSLGVDLLLAGYRLTGTTRQVDESFRFGDVLNNREETLVLRDVTVSDLGGRAVENLAEIAVEKSLLWVAMPKETEEYLTRQRLFRAGMARPNLATQSVLVIVPPFCARGLIHIPPGIDAIRFVRGALPRFFPLTSAKLSADGQALVEAPILFLNRDLVASIARTPGSAGPDRRD